jgi:uncharacterized radical SAM superfamily Fe-S cluster-containing enzyme
MSAVLPVRDYTMLGTTQSLCPECLAVVPAKILVRDRRVYFRKRCPAHGVREDFVCSDAGQYDRLEFSVPGKVPRRHGVEPRRGCPLDCGLCTEHEQHTCIGLVELTDACNLKCPLCYASSGPGGRHRTLEEVRRAVDRLVEVEGRPEVLQLSGGEPTLHPDFERILDDAVDRPIDIVMINTNGLRFAHDRAFVDRVARHRKRVEVYLQFDGLRDATYQALRGEPLADVKARAVAALGEAGLRTILVATLQPAVNDDEIGAIVRFGIERKWVTGVSFQPATYSGRHVLPETLERRITFPDVIRGVCEQTDGLFTPDDFLPLPCAHPNCHQLTYAYRSQGRIVPLLRFIDAKQNLDLLANGITFTRPRARQLMERYLGKLGCCAGGDCGGEGLVSLKAAGGSVMAERPPGFDSIPSSRAAVAFSPGDGDFSDVAGEFFSRALVEQLDPEDVFRITITSFLDPYNFDVRRVMKCCTHHILPSGHIVPFCAYNTLYRPGIVPLPPLVRGEREQQARGGR